MTWDFRRELARFGPGYRDNPVPRTTARTYCAQMARTHGENFTVASVLLPRRLLPHFHAVYAYCRWADDLADETGGGADTLRLLDWWRSELDACYAGRPRHPVMVALRETITRFGIPPDPFRDLLSAFEQDQRVKEYDTFDQLLDYCRRSADPVGRIVLYLFECHSPDRAALSDQVCTGLQLANFWQDVARDHAIGRVYLPAEDRRRFGYRDANLRDRKFNPAFRDLLRYQVQRTRGYFDRGRALLPRVPPAVRADVDLFARGGVAVLDAIEDQGYDVWARRPVVTKRTKALLLGRAVVAHWRGRFDHDPTPAQG